MSVILARKPGGGSGLDTAAVQALIDASLNAHLTDASDAHDAAAASVADAGGFFAASEVEAALQEVVGLKLIEEKIIGAGGAQNFDFQNIPQVYRHLKLFLLVMSEANVTTNVRTRYNNVSTATYEDERMHDGAGQLTGQTSMRTGQAARSSASFFSRIVVDVPFYSIVTSKIQFAKGTVNDGTDRFTVRDHGFNFDTTAISRLTLFLESAADLIAGSRAVLYGVR